MTAQDCQFVKCCVEMADVDRMSVGGKSVIEFFS